MAHPLAKMFTWIKSLRHIPSSILACFSLAHFLRLWLGDHPLIYQILNFMLQPQETICLVSYFLKECTMVISSPIWWDWIGRGVGSSGSRCPPQSRLLVLLIKAFEDHRPPSFVVEKKNIHIVENITLFSLIGHFLGLKLGFTQVQLSSINGIFNSHTTIT